MIASRYPTRFLRSYVKSKLARDPMYEAVLSHVRDSSEPLLDVGCGVGVLEMFLRARGATMPIVALDADAKKIAVARRIAPDGVTFDVGNALALPPFRGTVIILDLLHYLTHDEQQAMLLQALERSMTVAEETFARAIGWLRVPRLNFPSVEQIVAPFHARGFEVSVAPMWGRTPLNNYLFVFSR